jgi:hypothetical protein
MQIGRVIDCNLPIGNGPEEWLRRIALSRSVAMVPEHIAVALVAVGFAERAADGALTATPAGRAYLDAQGIKDIRSREG